MSLFWPPYWSKVNIFYLELILYVFVMTKAVSNRKTCFYFKAVLLSCEHRHFLLNFTLHGVNSPTPQYYLGGQVLLVLLLREEFTNCLLLLIYIASSDVHSRDLEWFLYIRIHNYRHFYVCSLCANKDFHNSGLWAPKRKKNLRKAIYNKCF